jgi:hypothetical protein
VLGISPAWRSYVYVKWLFMMTARLMVQEVVCGEKTEPWRNMHLIRIHQIRGSSTKFGGSIPGLIRGSNRP